ncbi:allatostatin-A receptor-like [Amphiura filiformis]|uniref:allatostatin-A receptor-like n=1 Tax=Amphiura filiformis TaxID=82378 RepID=UPI003B21DDF9
MESASSRNFSVSFHNEEVSVVINTLLLSINGIIGLLGIAGNGLVCVVFLFERPVFGSITNTLILNQSVIDLTNSCLFILLTFTPGYNIDAKSIFFNIVCPLWVSKFPFWSISGASTCNLMLLSLERYFAISRPIKHKRVFTKKRARIYCISVWLLGFLFSLYIPLVQRVSEDHQCVIVWRNKVAQKINGIFIFLAGYLIPLFVICASYISIWSTLHKRVNSDQVQIESFSRAKKNVTITLFLVGIFFIICWSPDSFLYLTYNINGAFYLYGTTHKVAKFLVECNMIVNPVVYCIKYDKFRKALKNMFYGSRGVSNSGNSGSFN